MKGEVVPFEENSKLCPLNIRERENRRAVGDFFVGSNEEVGGDAITRSSEFISRKEKKKKKNETKRKREETSLTITRKETRTRKERGSCLARTHKKKRRERM
jgi:hypothetical protein